MPGSLAINIQLVDRREYLLFKYPGGKEYIPVVHLLGRRRILHKRFTKASNALEYRSRVLARLHEAL